MLAALWRAARRQARRRTCQPTAAWQAPPKFLPVVDQDLDGRAPTVAEDEQRPAEWVKLQAPSAGLRQSVDAGSEIDRLDRHQNAHVRRERDHGALRKPVHTPAKPARPAPLSATRIVAPRPLWRSITQSRRGAVLQGCVATHSTNKNGRAFHAGLPDGHEHLALSTAQRLRHRPQPIAGLNGFTECLRTRVAGICRPVTASEAEALTTHICFSNAVPAALDKVSADDT